MHLFVHILIIQHFLHSSVSFCLDTQVGENYAQLECKTLWGGKWIKLMCLTPKTVWFKLFYCTVYVLFLCKCAKKKEIMKCCHGWPILIWYTKALNVLSLYINLAHMLTCGLMLLFFYFFYLIYYYYLSCYDCTAAYGKVLTCIACDYNSLVLQGNPVISSIH